MARPLCVQEGHLLEVIFLYYLWGWGAVSDVLLTLPREGTQALGYTGVPWHIAG